MSYLLDKKTKRNKNIKIFLGIIIFVFLLYFRVGIFNGLSYAGAVIFRPIISSGNNIAGKLATFGAYLSSKSSLSIENENLKSKIEEDRSQRANYDSIVAENEELKGILSRKNEEMNLVLSAILAKPNQSPFDTLIIDIGEDKEVKVGDRVFAYGNVPIGRVAEVYYNSSKVALFSSSGESTPIIVSGNTDPVDSTSENVSLEVIGRGGGNFEMIIPRDFTIMKGDQAILPGITPYVVGVVETVISDQRDSFQKALLVSPVNIQGLKFVQIEIQK